MSIHQPPQKSSAIFNDSNFISNDKALTIDEASKSFITYPTAQGKINLLDVDIGGTADFKSIPKTSIAPLEDNHLANKLYVDTLVGSDVTIDTTQTITGAKTFTNTTTFNGNVINNGTITTTGNSTFGDTESDQVVVNSYTWLKNDVRFGNDELSDTLLNQCRSVHQAISLFRDDVLAYPQQTDIYATPGCYLGTTTSGHAVLANSTTGASQGGFQYRVFDKDGTPLSTPLEISGTNNNYKTVVRGELNPQNGLTVAGTITLPANSLTISNVDTLETELTTIKSDITTLQTVKADDIDVVHLTGIEAIAGDKTFGDDVIVNGDIIFQNSSLELVNVETELGLKANDADIVHNTGNETISGVKTFTDGIIFNGNATIGDASTDALIVNSSTQLNNNVVIGDSKITDLLTVGAKSLFQGMTIFRDAFQENNVYTDKTATAGLYLGTTSSGHGLLAVPNTGAANGFLFRNIDKDGITLNTPLNINQNGSCSFSGNVSITGTLNQTGDTVFGTTESNQVTVNSFTWLKNDVRFGNDELTDTFVNQCRSDFQARTVFRDALNAYQNQIDIYATQGLYLGALSNGRAIFGSPNNGTENGFQFSNFSKDGLILNTPFYITQDGVCVTNGKLQVSADEFKVVDGAAVTLPANSLSISNVNTLKQNWMLKQLIRK